MEETGYDAASGANEKDCLTLYVNGQQTTMYIVTGVDEGFRFEPQVRPCPIELVFDRIEFRDLCFASAVTTAPK